MSYVTKAEVESLTSFANTDFKVAGVTMTEAQWTDLITSFIPVIDQAINRYCNVTSFDSSTSIVEYHSGRGASDDEGIMYSGGGLTLLGPNVGTYLTSDRTFYLRELMYSMTSVEEDISSKTSVPNWTTRVVRTALVPGDYEVITQNELTKVIFNQNIPLWGENNVRITYNCGYGAATPQYLEIKLQALRMMSNLLLHKKKIQEAVNIRAQGVRDYSQMFDIMNESAIMTENITLILNKYRRFPIEGDMFL